MKDLQGKTAVVTGAASGIGLAMTEEFLAASMNVVMADIEEGPLVTEAERFGSGSRILAVTCDVADYESVERLRDETVREFGSAHVLCNNAGVAPGGPMLETTADDWKWVLDVNVAGVAHGVIAFGPLMKAQDDGHIVNTASMAGHVTSQMLGAYCASKHAVVGLSESLYRELEDTNVGVSVLCPEFVKTAIFESERNRPNPTRRTAEQQEMMGMMKERMFETAISTSSVSADVLSAILEDRFWIFTHEGSVEMTRLRTEEIEAGHNPTPWVPAGS